MPIYLSKIWWQNCYQAIKCIILRIEIWLLLYGENDEITMNQINRLVMLEKYRHPNKPEDWYLEKIINDLRRKISA